MSTGTRVGNPPSGDRVASPPLSDDSNRIAEPSGDQAGAPPTTDSIERSWSIERVPGSPPSPPLCA